MLFFEHKDYHFFLMNYLNHLFQYQNEYHFY